MQEATVFEKAPAAMNSKKSLGERWSLGIPSTLLAAINLALTPSYRTKCTTVSLIPIYEAVMPL